MGGALKVGDRALWASLFATWTCVLGDGGQPSISPWGAANLETSWALGRTRILDDMVDLRLVWADDPVMVFRGDAFKGAPTIEQAVLEVDHLRLEPTR